MTVKAGDYYNRGRKRVDEYCKSRNPSWKNPAVFNNTHYKILEAEEEFEVEKIIIHPDFQFDDKQSGNDIALVKLDRPITFGQFKVISYLLYT